MRTIGARAYFAWGAIVLLVGSLALPVAQLPLLGTVSVFGLNDGTAYRFIGLAVLAAVAVLLKRYRLLALPGVLVLALTLWYVYQFDKMKHDLMRSVEGNIFSGVAQGLLSTVHLEYGIAFILVAGMALIVAAVWTPARRAPSSSG